MDIKNSFASRIKQVAAEVSGTSPLTVGRTKVDTQVVCGYDRLTLRDFDFISYTDKSTGELVEYPVLIFDEMPEAFYCGGMALSDLCKAIKNDDGLYEELKEQGLALRFESTRTKSNNTYVNFVVL